MGTAANLRQKEAVEEENRQLQRSLVLERFVHGRCLREELSWLQGAVWAFGRRWLHSKFEARSSTYVGDEHAAEIKPLGARVMTSIILQAHMRLLSGAWCRLTPHSRVHDVKRLARESARSSVARHSLLETWDALRGAKAWSCGLSRSATDNSRDPK